MGINRMVSLLLLLFLLTASVGWSAELHGRSSTQALWFEDYYNGTQVELAEYLRISATRIDPADKLAIYGYGRGTLDLNNGEGLGGRLYFLYGEYRDLYDLVDLRLGRQFVNISAGTALIDGAEVNLKNVGPVGLSVLGGRDVIFGLDGELTHEGNYVFGVAAYLSGFRNTDLDFSWFRKWDAGDVSRDILGASFKQYLFGNMKAYGYGRYDLSSEVFNELLGGIKYFPSASVIITGEWYQSYPTFDTTDVYSVFAVNQYEEGVLRIDYGINEMLGVFAGYNRQDYGDDGNADVFEIGGTIRPVPTLAIGVEYDRRHGYGGKLDGGMLDVAWDATQALQLGAGMTIDSYEREMFHSSTGDRLAQKYWGGVKYRLARNMTASLRLEDDVNESYQNNFQGRFIFNYDF